MLQSHWFFIFKDQASRRKFFSLQSGQFLFAFRYGTIYKNSSAVRYPKYLDIGHYMIHPHEDLQARIFREKFGSPIQTKDERNLFYFGKPSSAWQWKADGAATTDQPSSPSPDSCFDAFSYLYQLNAVVLHYGSHDSGHFVAYRRVKQSETQDAWFYISDRDVQQVDESRVFEHGCQFVYMLFYEIITKTK